MVRTLAALLSLFFLLTSHSLHAQSSDIPPPAEDVTRAHAFSILGKPGLPADFANFPYVNPSAPKGGEIVLGALGSFDSFNPFVVRGTPATVSGQVYDTLMRSNVDEPEVVYCHLAESIDLPANRRWVAFNLRPLARFQDGQPVTAADVVWTFNMLREKGRPLYKQYYADVADAVAEGPHRVVFHFSTDQNRELPLILGQLAILPQHWWANRDFASPINEPPIGSGPYRIGRFDMGRTVVLERVKDYWARDLPTAKGLANFDSIRTEYFRDATVAMEAFKSGQIDLRQENISKNWATAYDFPAVQQGLVRKEAFPHRLPSGMQGFAMNTRRPIFANRDVRHGIAELFDFEWMNKNLFFGAYTRTESYFSNSDLASAGMPTAEELALLDPFKADLPPAVFTKPFMLAKTDGSGNNREGLRAALALFERAGWKLKDLKLVDPSGKQMAFEILSDDPTMERVATPYVQWLARVGIDARVRTVDPAQYQRLTDTFDYDMTMTVIPQSDNPGNEQRDNWGCGAAKAEGSNNLMGVCNTAVDALVEKIIAAPDREALKTASHALDRILLNEWYMVPNWHLQSIWVAYWNRFGHPTQPVRTGWVLDSWWVDATLAAATDKARSAGN